LNQQKRTRSNSGLCAVQMARASSMNRVSANTTAFMESVLLLAAITTADDHIEGPVHRQNSSSSNSPLPVVLIRDRLEAFPASSR
jgi:hypothetical protein